MADTKITALTAISTNPVNPATFPIPMVDLLDTSMAASGTTKKVTVNQILGSGGTATLASATITGAATVGTTLGVTGVSTFAAGTALLPALTTTGDTNTGIYYPAADTFAVTTGGTERYRVDSTGLGIGASPSAKLHVLNTSLSGTTAGSNVIATLRSNGSGYDSFLQFSDNVAYNAGLGMLAGNLYFYTGGAERLRLDASGNLLVGKTANYGTGETNTLQLKSLLVFGSDDTANAANRNWSIGTNASAAGNMEWTIGSTNTGWPNFAYRMQITSAGSVNNTTGTYGTISDLRLKENISDARNYLADLLKLRVVKYSLKEESSAVATKLGFIAQEVEQVFPNLVDQSDKEYEGAEGIRSVKTSILIPMLLKAIQELTARVQTLEAK